MRKWFHGPRGRAQGGKYHAIQTFVLDDGTTFVRSDLLALAAYRGVATEVMVKHRTSPPSPRSLTLRELAVALRMRGEVFASTLEARRWSLLRREELGGRLCHLRRQVVFPLHSPGGTQVAKYVADFVYEQDGQMVVEDAKGMALPMYKLKAKHFAAEYGIQVNEVRWDSR
jgi:hypothetical protein